jgi:hypothetical protein
VLVASDRALLVDDPLQRVTRNDQVTVRAEDLAALGEPVVGQPLDARAHLFNLLHRRQEFVDRFASRG